MKENKREGTFTCGGCLEEFPMDQLHEFDGRNLCPECLQEETAVCSVCGERIWSYDNAGTEGTPLCQQCYDRYYTSCERCGVLLRQEYVRYAPNDYEEEHPLCDDCMDQVECSDIIQDYYHKPEPIFFGTGPRFFGVELEIDEAGESSCNASRPGWEKNKRSSGESIRRKLGSWRYSRAGWNLSVGFLLRLIWPWRSSIALRKEGNRIRGILK